VNDNIATRAFEIDFLVLGHFGDHSESDSGVDPEGMDSVDSGYGSFRLPSPKLTVNCISKDVLNLTVSKTSLKVMNELSASFSEAAKLEMKKRLLPTAPFVLKNDIGGDVVLELARTRFRVVENQRINASKQWVVTGDEVVGLDWVDGVSKEGDGSSKSASTQHALPAYMKGVDEILKEQDLPEQRQMFVTVSLLIFFFLNQGLP
jgi:hypothetical protein